MPAGLLSNEGATLKRLVAILLFAATLLPFALPGLALAQEDGSGLPACCRRQGAHHCAMRMGERDQMIRMATSASADTRHWHAPHACCPYCPAAAPSLHFEQFARFADQVRFSFAYLHPQGVVQTESRWRVARERSRGKRGPPPSILA